MADLLLDLWSGLDDDLRRFAAAVSQHLSTQRLDDAEAPVRLAAQIVLLLDPDGLDDEEAAEALLGSPELLASFFQNADLLGHGSESAQRVVRVVTLALERAWES